MKLTRSKPASGKRQLVFVAAGVVSVLIMTGIGLAIVSRFAPTSHVIEVDQDSLDRLVSKSHVIATMEDRDDIVAQFTCPCGRCRVLDNLKDCRCTHRGGATEIKDYIYDRIHENRYSGMEIVDMVSKQYGGRKKLTS
jgi:hypothetical protein